MSLGFALLHPNRLDVALKAGPQKRAFDKMIGIVCGALGIDGLQAEIEGLVQSNGEALEGFFLNIADLFKPGQPLAHLTFAFEIDFENPESLGELFERFCAFADSSEPAQIRAVVMPVVDAVLEALPTLDTEIAAGFAASRLDEIVGLLKTPLRRGRKDVAAIKAYRAAMTLECLFEPAYRKLAAFGRIDLRAVFRTSIVALLARLDGVNLGPLRDLLRTLKDQFGGLLAAIIGCVAGGQASAGAQFMSNGNLTVANEVQATPHTSRVQPGIFGIDVGTNILIMFNLIWETARVRPFKDRGGDGALMIIGVIWHTLRFVLRAAIPDHINRPVNDDDNNAGHAFVNWLFSDWGDFAVHLLLRLFMTAYEFGDGKENWALMFLPRFLTYLTNTLNFRLIYQFARSIWYLKAHDSAQADLDALGTSVTNDIINQLRALFGRDDLGQYSQARLPLGRLFMAFVPIVWWINMFVGWGLPWEGFEAETLYQDAPLGWMLGFAGLGWILSQAMIAPLMGLPVFSSFAVGSMPDLPLVLTVVAAVIIFMVSLVITTTGLESGSSGAALGASIGIPLAILALLFVTAAIGWWAPLTTGGGDGNGNGDDDGDGDSDRATNVHGIRANAVFTAITSLLVALGMGAASSMTWWFLTDDSRDERELFPRVDRDDSPYLLPYREGENWFCGQSFHGVFSHLFSSESNHYAYDFNEAQGSVALATRTGITVAVTQDNPSNLDDQNVARVMHTQWTSAADPGSDDERVITYTTYVHFDQFGVRARPGQIVPQGVHFGDIDSTGRSAVHHLHLAAVTSQRNFVDSGGTTDQHRESIPFVMRDESLTGPRIYPALRIGTGADEIPGRPLSFAFYISDNEEQEPHPVATTVEMSEFTAAAGAVPGTHAHRVLIDRSMLTGGTIPNELTLRTTVDAGHFHEVTIGRADLIRLFRLQAPGDVQTSEVLGHQHTLQQSNHLGGAWPWADDTGTMSVEVTDPPPGQLIAHEPGPYNVLGQRMIVRVNDRATEWFLYAGRRARNVADTVMDAGFSPALTLTTGPNPSRTLQVPPVAPPRPGTRDTALGINQGLGDEPLVARAEPVLVLETRRRGTDARLELTGGTAPASILRDAALTGPSSGTGAFADLADVDPNDLATHVNAILQNGWPTPPAGFAAAMMTMGAVLRIEIAGAAPDFSASSPRLADVLTGLHDAGNNTLRATGPMPLAPGRLAVDPGYSIPLLAAPAQVRIAAPAEGTTVTIMANNAQTVLTTRSADAAAVARQIMQTADGLRAWEAGGDIFVETLSAGPNTLLSVTPTGASTETDAGNPAPSAAVPFDDLTMLLPTELEALIDDALNRDTVPAAVLGSNPRASFVDDHLRIEVDDTEMVSLGAFEFTGDTAPFTFESPQAEPHVLLSEPLLAPVELHGPAWIDVVVGDPASAGSYIYRIPLDGEPARLDLVFDRLPGDGETLDLDVNGSAETVTFGAGMTSMAAVAEAIGAALPDMTVRIAYRLAIEDRLWGIDGNNDIDLLGTGAVDNGLALAGFLGPRDVPATPRLARGRDMLAQGSTFPGPERQAGAILPILTVEQTDPGAGPLIRLSAPDPVAEINITAVPGNDPLNFTGGVNPADSDPQNAPIDLGGHGLRYRIELLDDNANLIATSHAQLAAQPAIARATADAQLPLAEPTVLTLQVTGPGGIDVTAEVDITGVADLDEVASRINASAPQLRSWVASVPPALNARDTRTPAPPLADRLHVETVGGGHAWRLTVGDVQTAAALGLPLTALDGDVLSFPGAGNVADARAATLAEFEDALLEAEASVTGSVNEEGTPEAFRVTATVVADRIELRSTEGRIDVVAEPPVLADQLSVEVTDQVTRIGPAPAVPGAPVPISAGSGRLLLRQAGQGLAAVEIFGSPAELIADQPVPSVEDDINEMLDAMRLHQIVLEINGAPRTLPLLPASVTTVEGAVATLAAATDPGVWEGDDWWIGLVSDPPGTPARCVIQTRMRGLSANLRLDLSAFPDIPAAGILGFLDPGVTAADGGGNLADLDAIPVTTAAAPMGSSSIEDLVREAIDRGAARQAVYAVDRPDATTILLRSSLPTQTLQQQHLPGTAPPDAVPGDLLLLASGTAAPVPLALPAPAPNVEATLAGVLGLDPGVLRVVSDDTATPDAREVRALFHAEPARLSGFGLATDPAQLDGRILALDLGGVPIEVTFATTTATTPLELARQIEQQSGWRLRVLLDLAAATFDIETLDRGSGLSLDLGTPASGDNAVTGNAANGLTGPSNTTADGTGSLPSIRAVDADAYAEVLRNAMIAQRAYADATIRDQGLALGGSTYDPPQPDRSDAALPIRPEPKEFARLISQRNGAASSVVPLDLVVAPDDVRTALIDAFSMDRSLERGPAVRAAIRIPPFEEQNLSGRLYLQFNENAGTPDLPPEQNVMIEVPDASYDPPALAGLINARLAAAGIGAAQAYRDGSIMIETAVNGLAGTVRLPGAAMPDNAAERALGELLLPSGAFDRGWPNAGRGTRNPGFRARPGNASTVVDWTFTDSTGATVTVTEGSDATPATPETVAESLNREFAATARIGMAAVGADEALYIEGWDADFALTPALDVDPPESLGMTPERREEPAMGLRRTHEARTVRFLRDRNGHGVLAEHDDFGWVRLPCDPLNDGVPLPINPMPWGRMLALMRTDAAKAHAYDASGEMFAVTVPAAGDDGLPVVLAARYWLTFDDSIVLGVTAGADGQPMVVLERQVFT